MNYNRLVDFIEKKYRVKGDFPWKQYPDYCVFRHQISRKWFALFMVVDKAKVIESSGIIECEETHDAKMREAAQGTLARKDKLSAGKDKSAETQYINILNLKLSPELIYCYLGEEGFHPAYHMNKENWISVETERVDDETLMFLIDCSFQLTKSKKDIDI